MSQIQRLHAAIQYYRALGCWGMVEHLERILTGVLKMKLYIVKVTQYREPFYVVTDGKTAYAVFETLYEALASYSDAVLIEIAELGG